MKFIVACSPNTATGGPELLHQLCAKLLARGLEAAMFYPLLDHIAMPADGHAVHPAYRHYGNPYLVGRMEAAETVAMLNQPTNVLVVPEVMWPLLWFYPEARKLFWWLSVDNLAKATTPDAREIQAQLVRDAPELHLVQSHYARLHCHELGIADGNVMPLADYLNPRFFQPLVVPRSQRQDLVLYNPKKGWAYTERLIAASPSTWEWLPLQGLAPDEMATLMQFAKVYVDFGEHPGKDRIPREAAMQGCCVLTSRRGAAANGVDVPIPAAFKFDDTAENVPRVLAAIADCLARYDDVSPLFDEYREKIRGEEAGFDADLAALLARLQENET